MANKKEQIKEEVEKEEKSTAKKEAKKDSNRLVLEIKIEGEEFSKAVDEAFNRRNKNITIDGFRKGKAPRAIFVKKYGEETLRFDAAEQLIQKAYEKVLKENKVVPVVQPSVEIKGLDEKSVTYLFTIITKPKVTIKKYTGLNIKREQVEVTQDEIDHELGHLLEQYTEVALKENQVVEKNNIAVIDFEGFKDGVAFDGGKGENYSLEIGSHTFIPGFEEQVIGMKQGEEKEFPITFPKDYPSEELKGQKVTFKVVVHEVKEKVVRKLDEDFFEDLALEGVKDKASLEDEIKANILAQKEMTAENNYIDAILEAVGKEVEVDIPEEMVEEEIDRMMGQYEERMKMQGISMELYYQITKSTEKDLRSKLEKEAFSHVLYRLMLEEIMNLEKIEVSNLEAEEEAKKLADKYQMNEQEFLQNFGGIDMVQYDLEMRKTIEFLKEKNK